MSERRIVGYETAVEDTLDALDNVVRSYLNDGWEPHGSLAVCDNTNNPALPVAWVQPMVRYADPEPDDELARLAFELAERVRGLKFLARYKEFREPASAILAIKAKREGGAG